jgi:hypothetical protein
MIWNYDNQLKSDNVQNKEVAFVWNNQKKGTYLLLDYKVCIVMIAVYEVSCLQSYNLL